jgi:signal transduction histidine kinase
MIEKAADNNLNVSFGNPDLGCISDNQKTKSYKNPVLSGIQHLKSIEIPSYISNRDSASKLNCVIHSIEQLLGHLQDTEQLLDEVARVYVKILGLDGVCIFESHVDGNIKPLVYCSQKSDAQPSTQVIQDINSYDDCITPSVLSSLPAMTSALEKDQYIKLWQISSDENNLIYAISLPLKYNASTICAITLLSKDAQIFSSDNIDTFQIIVHLAASFLDKINQRNELEEKQIEKISLQDEIRKLQDQINAMQTAATGDPENTYKELEALCYSISHDLHAPLRAIYNNCDWLKTHHMTNLDADGRRVLQQIAESSENMEKLLDGLLEFSKVVQSEPKYRLIDMSALVNKVRNELLGTESASPSLSILVKPLINAYGDETLIRQVWYNLLSNAFKFSSHKQKREVEIDSYQLNGDITYCVSDNGAGFDMQYADRLFRAFHRLHGVEEFEGTGVGLAIVDRIIKRHGGRVWAEGKIDNGARFYFTLPKRQIKEKT